MLIYFFRHGQADWPHWKESDDKRPLNTRGVKETDQMAKFLRRLGLKPAIIISSPLPRAYQTASIVAEVVEAPIEEDSKVSKGFAADQLRSILEQHPVDEIIVVGHDPDFSNLLKILTGSQLKLAKSGVACVDLDDKQNGKLIWLLPPNIASV